MLVPPTSSTTNLRLLQVEFALDATHDLRGDLAPVAQREHGQDQGRPSSYACSPPGVASNRGPELRFRALLSEETFEVELASG
jgi:hypothetical protein